MNKKIVVIICLTLVNSLILVPSFVSVGENSSYLLSINMEWEKTYGGDGNDAGDSICETLDGGFFIVGETTSKGSGDRDIWIIKTDADGNIEWDKTFGGEYYDRGKHGIQTLDGGFIVVGYTSSFGSGSSDGWLIKTDANGNMEWEKTYGREGIEEGVCVQQTTDGGYIFVGQTNSYGAGQMDAWIIKTDSDGNVVWEKTFGEEFGDLGEWIEQTNDGGYIFTGCYGIHSDDVLGYNTQSGIWLVKIDGSGNMIWQTFFDNGRFNLGHAVMQTPDDGFIVTGWTNAGQLSGGDVFLIKTNAEGKKEWEKSFGEKYLIECAIGLDCTSDGGFVLTGCSGLITGWPAKGMIAGVPLLSKTLVIKTDDHGNIEWQEICGPGICMGRIVKQCSDGGYILVGNTGNHYNTQDLLLLRIN
jgi:hypothetical protein